jgi:hypothetical protein
MAAFLNALGIPNENGLISEDVNPEKPDSAKLAEAVSAIRKDFPTADVDLYLNVLQAQSPEVWGGLVEHVKLQASA